MSQLKTSLSLALQDLRQPRLWQGMLLPLGAFLLVGLGAGWLFWDEATGGVLGWLGDLAWVADLQAKLEGWFGPMDWLGTAVSGVVGLMVLISMLLALGLACLVLASALLAPWVADDVAKRHYPRLVRGGDAGFWPSLAWSFKALGQAALVLLVSLPFWVLPFVHLVVPPLVLGWLNSRVMSFDVLSAFASRAELLQLLRTHRRALLLMGVVAGWLSVAPAITWMSGMLFVALFFVLMPLAALIYMAVLLFTALWFSHFALQALLDQRIKEGV